MAVIPFVPHFAALLNRRRIPLPPSWTANGPLNWINSPFVDDIPDLAQLLTVINDGLVPNNKSAARPHEGMGWSDSPSQKLAN